MFSIRYIISVLILLIILYIFVSLETWILSLRIKFGNIKFFLGVFGCIFLLVLIAYLISK